MLFSFFLLLQRELPFNLRQFLFPAFHFMLLLGLFQLHLQVLLRLCANTGACHLLARVPLASLRVIRGLAGFGFQRLG